MQANPADPILTFSRSENEWTWRISPPRGGPITGQAPDLETARRTAAIVEGVLRSLYRARQRRG